MNTRTTALQNLYCEPNPSAVPVTVVTSGDFATWLDGCDARVQAWVRGSGYAAKAGTGLLVPGEDGRPERAIFTPDGADASGGEVWRWAGLAESLPDGVYVLDIDSVPAVDADAVEQVVYDIYLTWALAQYRFAGYRSKSSDASGDRGQKQLCWFDGIDRARVLNAAQATWLARDLVNTPAEHLGPAQLADVARDLAETFGATFEQWVGDALLAANFPAVHAVGRAAGTDRQPRMVHLTWGDDSHPRVALVGKGVCFDSGGLNIKSGGSMKLMKKDMGGAALVLGLAHMIMAARLPVALDVWIPAVENSISGPALRPGDVITTRKGLSVEINNTDAEGRVILADGLAAACEKHPAVLVNGATLTGAARVALGTEIPALFCNKAGTETGWVGDVLKQAEIVSDPVWQLPLWRPYGQKVKSKIADLDNAPEGGYGGAITAALFLEAFVDKQIPWTHLDLMAWNIASRPGRPEGGETQGMRAIFAALASRFA